MDVSHRAALGLQAALGWLELGSPRAALEELDQLDDTALGTQPELELRWEALAQLQDWDTALPVTRQLLTLAPDEPAPWLHHAYALRRASTGGLPAAYEALLPAYQRYPAESTIAFNLACYTCQLGHPPEQTLAWLECAIAIDGLKDVVTRALQDPDLAPLAEEIRKLNPR